MLKVFFVLLYLMVAALQANENLIVKGNKPSYLSSVTTDFANVKAVSDAAFVPDLELGFIPQGIEKFKKDILITGYDKKYYKCTVYKINKENKVTKQQVISGCKHAGAISLMGEEKLVVSDTKNLFILDTKNFKTLQKIPLKGKVRGSFITNDGKFWFIGVYAKDVDKSFIYKFTDEQLQNSNYLDENIAIQRIPIPLRAQGADFDSFGNLWITTNRRNYGVLTKYNTNFQVVDTYKTVRGLEDIDIRGKYMWIVSESGSKPYSNWPQVFPAYFKINLEMLE